MKNLKIWQKLVSMGAVFMVPFAVVTYEMISSINRLGIEFARQESRGVEYSDLLSTLLRDLQQHRGMVNAWLSGDASFKDSVASKRADIENGLRKMDDVDQRLNSALHMGQKWTSLRATWRDLLDRTSSLTRSESFQQHTKVIQSTIALIDEVGDLSNLSLDPDLDSYYLMRVLISQGPELSEALSQARGLGSGIAASKNGTAEQFETLTRSSVLAEYLRKGVDESLHKVFAVDPALKQRLQASSQASSSAVQEAARYVKELATRHEIDSSAAAYYATVTRGVDSIFEMKDQVAGALSEVLNRRVERFSRDVRYALALAALGMLVISIVGFLIMRDITVNLRHVVNVANTIAVGDLAVQTASDARRDKIGVLARAFDRMVTALRDTAAVAEKIAAGDLAVEVKPRSERDVVGNALVKMVSSLSTLVGEVHNSGIQVNTSVTEIDATSRQQQETASETAATTTEIGATSKEICATSRELVKSMIEVAAVAEQSASLAGSGQAGLSHMEETMRHVMEAAGSINAKLAVLNEKANNINQIVTTITKVADQTNLLSLNAAIEAEKAGEYGRGFAVVATEIRRLADQTAVATYDIEQTVKEMQSAVSAGVMGMDKFSEDMRRGMQEVQQVGNQLSEIIQQVQGLAPRFEAVNEGMQAQATGAEQISQALVQLSEAAQQTVESLRQSSQAIDVLNQAAGGLRSGVSRFKLAEASGSAGALA